MAPLIPFIGPVINIIGGWVKHKSDMATAKRTSELKVEEKKVEATIKRIEDGDAHAAELDEVSLRTRGWKDEYLLLLATIPVILCFIPDYVQYATAGFEALKSLPEWYMYVLLGVYIDTFGFRRMLRAAMEQWVAKRIK